MRWRGDEQMSLILAGMGLDEFSMSATSIPRVKKILRNYKFDELKALAEEAVNQPTIEDVKQLLNDFIG